MKCVHSILGVLLCLLISISANAAQQRMNCASEDGRVQFSFFSDNGGELEFKTHKFLKRDPSKPSFYTVTKFTLDGNDITAPVQASKKLLNEGSAVQINPDANDCVYVNGGVKITGIQLSVRFFGLPGHDDSNVIMNCENDVTLDNPNLCAE
ncbi:hypothetical protein D3C87_701520 [compost metagenome]